MADRERGEQPTPNVDSARSRVRLARVSSSPISVAECVAATLAPSVGAVVTFDGMVRDHDEGRGVSALGYSAHPTAQAVIEQVAFSVARDFHEVTLAVLHRIGDLQIGDSAITCAVTSAHRKEAFAACAELVDRVKESVPIWKEQEFDDGSTEWVNSIG